MRSLEDHARHFDALYAANDDPWDYATSPAEAFKRRAIGHMLGASRCGIGLELGCGNGTSTIALASHFARLVAVDGSPRAVSLARESTQDLRHVLVLHRRFPGGFPTGRYDAVIASEVLYYLPASTLTSTLLAIRSVLLPGGCLVVANSIAPYTDRAIDSLHLTRRLQRVFHSPTRTVVGAGWRLDRFRKAY